MIRDQTSYSEYTVNISVVLCSVKAHGCDKAVGGIINRKVAISTPCKLFKSCYFKCMVYCLLYLNAKMFLCPSVSN